VLEALLPYVEAHLGRGGRLNNVVRHILGLYHGQPHARAFRRHLSQHAPRPGAGIEVLIESMRLIEEGYHKLDHDRIGAPAP
jgi:tRNA-dihydrouridine synthase A